MKDLLRFEFYYFTRQPACILALLLAITIGYLLSGKVVISGGVQLYSPQNLTYFLTMMSLPLIAIATLLASCSLLRDKTSHFLELIQATPVNRQQLKLSRFVSLFLTTIGLATFTYVCYLLPSMASTNSAEINSAWSFSHIIWPFIFILLPNLLLICSVLFLIGEYINKTLWVYLSGLAIYIFLHVGKCLFRLSNVYRI